MITRFRIKNFRSIVDLVLDMTYGEKRAPNGYREMERLPFIEDGSAHAVPCLALFGANAAGKSNVIRGVRSFMEMVGRKKVDVRRLYDPNQIVTTVGASTMFEGEIVKAGHVYRYSIEYSAAGIVAERLDADGRTIYSIDRGRCDFSGLRTDKTYDNERLAKVHEVECRTADGVVIYPLLPIFGLDFGGLDAALSSAFRSIAGGVSVFFDDFGPQFLPMAIEMLSKSTDWSRGEALCNVVEVVRRLDVDILSLDIIEHGGEQFDPRKCPYDVVKHEGGSGRDFGISIYSRHHNDKGEDVVFRFLDCESEGTKRLAVVVAVVLNALATGSAVLFDEFDRGLHPLLVRELLSLFQKRSYNPKGAQICFATHCTDILDESVMRMSEIGIVAKNIRTGTVLWRLSDLRRGGARIRNVTDFRKQYLDGFYSGVPYPAI